MQDQAKRLMLAVGLALVVMVSWNYFFSPPPPDKPAATIESPTGTAPAAAVMLWRVARSALGSTGSRSLLLLSPSAQSSGSSSRSPTSPPSSLIARARWSRGS